MPRKPPRHRARRSWRLKRRPSPRRSAALRGSGPASRSRRRSTAPARHRPNRRPRPRLRRQLLPRGGPVRGAVYLSRSRHRSRCPRPHRSRSLWVRLRGAAVHGVSPQPSPSRCLRPSRCPPRRARVSAARAGPAPTASTFSHRCQRPRTKRHRRVDAHVAQPPPSTARSATRSARSPPLAAHRRPARCPWLAARSSRADAG